MSKLRKLVSFLRLMPLLVTAPAVLLVSGGAADAQDELPPIADVRDLSVRVGVDVISNVYVYVQNHSTIPMRNVQVRLTTDPPAARAGLRAGDPGRPREHEASVDYDPASGIITFSELSVRPAHFDYQESRAFISIEREQSEVVKVRAEIIGSVPAEEATKLDNNQADLWVHFICHNSSCGPTYAVRSNTSISTDVVNRSPAQSENYVFKVVASEAEPQSGATADTEAYELDVAVKVALSEGLDFAGTPTPPSGTTFSRTSPTTGVWYLGQGERVTGQLEIPVRLTTDVWAAPPLNRRCLTAQIVGGRPPATAHPEHGKVHIECLGRARQPVVISDGDPAIVGRYCPSAPFVYPCREGGGLDILAVDTDVDLDAGEFYRSEDVIFLVDPVEHQTAGTNSGTTWLWSTGQALSSGHNDYDLPGVRLTLVTARNTVGKSRKFTISDVSPPERPGTIAMVDRYLDNGVVTLYETLNPDKSDKLEDSLQENWGDEFKYLAVFSAPGLYKVNLGREWIYESDDSMYSVSGTLTFVVGAVSDLQVHDAGMHGALPEGQQAYTLRAWNNLDEAVELVEVALTGVPQGAKAKVSEDGDTYEQGDCDINGLCSGIWKIGDLEGREERHLSGRSDGPTLTLLVDGDGAKPITATITSGQTRTVTAGGESYTYGVTDLDDSNSKDVKVAVGTGRGEPDPELPKSLRVDRIASVALVRWSAVEEVSRWPVAFYQVERDNRILDVEVKNPLYLDLQASGNHVYRVRAVSEAGIPGPWSGSIPDAPGDFTVALSDGGNGAVLSWTAPASPLPITGYVIDISDSAEGDSRTNDRTVGANVTTWTHTGLSGGDVKFYRVQARNRAGVGEWTEWQSVSTGPGAPGSLRARANGPSEIVLTWSEASSRDVTIYEYELEYSDTSASEGYEWTFLQTVLHDEGLRYVDNTVSHGTTRYYRVRGRTLQGNVGGAWSNVASATTSAAGPSPPLNVSADFAVGNTENGILLTWDAPASGDASYYRIEHSTDGGATWESESNRHTGTCDVGGTTKFCYTDSGLFSGTEHWYRVAGVNRSGVPGEWSAPVNHVTQGEPTEAPGEPQNLRITGVSGRQVSLAWDAPADDGGTRITGYEYMVEGPCVHAPEEICQVVKPTRTGGTTRTVTVPNFRGRYEFYVRALNAVGAGWWSQPVGQYVNPQRNWRVSLSPSRLTVTEGGEATYQVRLTSDPGQPVWVALDWYGDDDLGEGHSDRGIPSLSEQQFKWLLPSNYASRNPDIYLDPDYTAPWNTGVTITVTAHEDDDSENGTAEIRHDVFYIPCAELGNPAGCVDDPEDTGVTAYLTVTERDNTP